MVESVGRVFVAVGLPPEVRQAVSEALERVPVPGRPVHPADLHLTLRFLGDVDEVAFDRLLMELDSRDWPGRFPLMLTGLGAFPHPRSATVAWLGVADSPELAATQGLVEDACDDAGLGREERPFRPHVTLARIRPPADLRMQVASFQPLGIPFVVSRLVVLRSNLGGAEPRYEPLEFVGL